MSSETGKNINVYIYIYSCEANKEKLYSPSKCFSFSHTEKTSNHGADGVEIGVKADDFPLSSFCVGVVHGILKSGLSVVVLVDRASCVLRFICFPLFVEIKAEACKDEGKERHEDSDSNRTAVGRATGFGVSECNVLSHTQTCKENTRFSKRIWKTSQ